MLLPEQITQLKNDPTIQATVAANQAAAAAARDAALIETNDELQECLKSAQSNWDLDDETDPDGKIAKGLKIGLSGDLDDDEVRDVFQKSNFPKGSDKWDALETWAKSLAG